MAVRAEHPAGSTPAREAPLTHRPLEEPMAVRAEHPAGSTPARHNL